MTRTTTAALLLVTLAAAPARARRAELASLGGWDAAGFSRFYQAARIGYGPAVVRPPEARLELAAPARADAPVPSPEYRRTFRILLSRPEQTDRYDELILERARAHKLDARLLKAIIAAESEFSAAALSPKGARGLMQIMPKTAEGVGVTRERLSDPAANIEAGAAYLEVLHAAAWKRYKLKGVRYHEAPLWLKQRIIAAYNAGPKFLFKNGGWYRETHGYVRKVLLFYHSPVTDIRRSAPPSEPRPRLTTRPFAGALY